MSQSNRKLLVVTPSVARSGGGVTEALVNVCNALYKDGTFVPTVIACAEKGKEEPNGLDREIDIELARYSGPSNFRFSLRLLWKIFKTDATIIHVHGVWMFHCLAVFLASKVKNIPYIVTPHGMLEPWIINRSRLKKRIITSLYQRQFLRSASFLHALNSEEQNNLLRWNKNVFVNPNFVTPPDSPPESPEWKTSRYAGKTTFLFLGRIHEKKGCFELLQAWSLACEQDEEFRLSCELVFVGWNDGLSGFEDAVDKVFDKFGNAKYVGPQHGKEKWNSLSAATFFVLPSKSEGLPMAVLEAWSLGLPTLLTRECNLDIGFSEGAAILISTDAEKLSRDLIRASRISAEEQQRMGQKGQRLVAHSYSSASVVRKFIGCFDEAIDAK